MFNASSRTLQAKHVAYNGNIDTKETKPKAGIPWKPWFGVAYVIATFYASQFVAGFGVSIYASLRHMSNAQASDWLSNSIPAQFIYVLLAEALAIGAIYWYVRRFAGGLKLIGLRKPRWLDPLYALAVVPAYYLLYFVAVVLVSHYVPAINVQQQQEVGFTDAHGAAQLLMTFISLVVLPPLAEEIMVRGMLYSSLKKGLPVLAAAITTSLIFAAAHLPEGGGAGPLYIAAVDTFILSMILVYLREKTGGLWASMTLHAIKNGVAFLALFVLHLS